MNIISWNINGLKSSFYELKELIKSYHPDLVCLQKVRCAHGRDQYRIDGYHALYCPIDCGNNSGVMAYVKIPEDADRSLQSLSMPERVHSPELSEQGHLQIFDCNSFYLFNAYVPFANKGLAGAVEYRKNWDVKFRQCVTHLSSLKPVIICGDLNVVHTQKDTCEKSLSLNRGCFFQWERDNFNALLHGADLVDTFRHMHPDEQAVTFYGNFRSSRIGNRIDYFLMSRRMLPRLNASEILTNFGTGQSVPIVIVLN